MSQTLTTGVPWLDHVLASLAALGALCSILSHAVPPNTLLGKLISWGALNFGKALVKQDDAQLSPPRGSASLAVLVALAAVFLTLSGCSLFKGTLAHDLEVDCGEPAIAAAAAVLLPEVLDWAKGQSVDWMAQLEQLESSGEDAALCAAATGIADFDPTGVTAASGDGGPALPVATATDGGPAQAISAAHAPPALNLVIAANLRAFLARHPAKPRLAPRG